MLYLPKINDCAGTLIKWSLAKTTPSEIVTRCVRPLEEAPVATLAVYPPVFAVMISFAVNTVLPVVLVAPVSTYLTYSVLRSGSPASEPVSVSTTTARALDVDPLTCVLRKLFAVITVFVESLSLNLTKLTISILGSTPVRMAPSLYTFSPILSI